MESICDGNKIFIKRAVMQGFKSYRGRTIFDNFDKRHNIIIGANGAGKSNFLFAIQFVLSNEFVNLRFEHKQCLINYTESKEKKACSAFVEITFDNSDQLLTDSKEIIIRRTIVGDKNDQYMLNNKIVPRSEIVNLLKSFGFSVSNPYYIVKQGKINQLAIAPDSERIKLLLEIAGAQVYDDRRQKSEFIFDRSNSSMTASGETLKSIEEHLERLKREQKDLQEYMEIDKKQRVLEHIIIETELKQTIGRLDKFAEIHMKFQDSKKGYLLQIEDLRSSIQSSKHFLNAITTCVTNSEKELNRSSEVYQEHLKNKAKLDLKIKDLALTLSVDESSKLENTKKLEILLSQIAEKKNQLETMKTTFTELKNVEEKYTRDIDFKGKRCLELYAKEGRIRNFTGVIERNQWIEKEVGSLNTLINEKKYHIKSISDEIAADSEKLTKFQNELLQQHDEIDKSEKTMAFYDKIYYKEKSLKDNNNLKESRMWAEESKLREELAVLKEQLLVKENSLRGKINKNILNGIKSVKAVLHSLNQKGGEDLCTPKGYYGLVVDNFTCNDLYFPAVEMSAGNQVFHHIVETDKIATEILKEMGRLGLSGQVSFMCLNRLKYQAKEYPVDEDVQPITEFLDCHEKYTKVINNIFGNILLCKDMDTNLDHALRGGFNCVTLEGELISSRGSLTGGYIDRSASKLKIYNNISKLEAEITEKTFKIEEMKKSIKELQEVSSNINEAMQKSENKKRKSEIILEKIKSAISLSKDNIAVLEDKLKTKGGILADYEASLKSMESSKMSLEKESKQDMYSQLSSEDKRELNNLKESLKSLKKDYKEILKKRLEVEQNKNKLEQSLNIANRQKEELLGKQKELLIENNKRKLAGYQGEMEVLEKKIDDVNNMLKSLEKKLDTSNIDRKFYETKLETLREKQREVSYKYDAELETMEKYYCTENLLQAKKSDCISKIEKLGTLPSPKLYARYCKLPLKKLFEVLKDTNQKLKSFKNINKKAMEQYLIISEENRKVISRYEILLICEDKIKKLMEKLERMKNETIEYTFKQVSKNFNEIFRKLVPNGVGNLVVKSRSEEEPNINNYSGVSIRVSFGGYEMKDIKQLSGGQKTLVALAFIFAIQQFNPAPFYLLDEVDQALDQRYRSAVANMVHELSANAQFITTTFRLELLERANKFYCVNFLNHTSTVSTLTKEDAMAFLELNELDLSRQASAMDLS